MSKNPAIPRLAYIRPKGTPAEDATIIVPLAYSRGEAAIALGVDIQTIDSLIASKALRASKIGRRVLIKLRDIEAMLDASTV